MYPTSPAGMETELHEGETVSFSPVHPAPRMMLGVLGVYHAQDLFFFLM